MAEPIVTRLPETQRAVENKYQNNPDLLSGYDSPVAQAIYNLDVQRSQKGQNPLSVRQTQLALQAAQTGQAVTQAPSRSFFGNVVNDFRQLTASVPRLPLAMYHELQALPDIGESISAATAQQGLLNQISGIAKAPGIRLIPGSFIAGNLNHPSELLQHPVFTALDALPIAEKAGVLDKAAEIAKPKLTPVVKALGSTKVGQFVKAGFGTEARDLAQVMNKYDTKLTDAAGNTKPLHELSQDPALNAVTFATREGYEIRKRYPNIAEPRRIELTRMIQEDPIEIKNLSGDELAFVTDTRNAIHTFGNYGAVDQGMLDVIDGEIYDKQTASKILGTRQKAAVASAYNDAREAINNPIHTRNVASPDRIAEWEAMTGKTWEPVTLYRGEGSLENPSVYGDMAGSFYTTNKEKALNYASSSEGRLKSVVINDPWEWEKIRDGNNPQDHVIVPPEYREQPTPENLINKMEDTTYNVNIKAKDKVKIIEGYAHALDAAGYDASPILKYIKQIRNTKSPLKYDDELFREHLARVSGDITPRSITVDMPSFMENLSKIAKTDPQSRLLLDQISKSRWSEAKVTAGRLARRKVYAIPDLENVVDEIARQRDRNRYMNQTANYSEKAVAKAQKVAENQVRTNPPARFQPYIDKQVQSSLMEKYSDSPDFDQILPLLKERNYSFLDKEGLIPEAEVKQLGIDMRKTWQDMKRDGIDPVFVHRVSEGQIGSIKYPKVLERIPRPSQTVKRSWNLTPTIDDVTVAVTHQGLEWLARRGSEEFIDEMLTRWGRSQQDLMEQYLPAARKSANTPDDVIAVTNRLMRKEWTKYNPDGIITWPSPRIKRWSSQEVWVPKTIAENIQRMHTPPGGRLTSVIDPIMHVFRTSLLPLAPRWHFYNILGGGIMLMSGTDPSVWRYLSEAREMVKAGDLPEDIPRGIGTVPRDVLEWNAKGSIQKPLEAVFQYKGGQQLRKFWDSAQEARGKFGDVIEKSYAWNGMVDDTYRAMAYLYGKDKSLTKGMTTEAAQKAGVELARKVFQQWDRMTPIERSIMRFIFPFYGWTAHVMNFVMHYPFDHPTRAAIVGSFARNEVNDMGTGLPERFLNMFFLGDTDKNGNVKAFNLGGMNPFRDVANSMTLAGFVGQTNPLISSAFQALGVDVSNGGPELFPNVQYDPELGRLSYKPRNPLAILAESILPQSRILTGMADSSSEFQQLLRNNPEAAGRLITSQLGLPITFRYVNPTQEIAKAEVARDEAQSTALNQALKSGDWSQAEGFPNLRPIFARLKELQASGQLQQYTPQSSGQSAIGLAQSALASVFRPHVPSTTPYPGSTP